MRHAARVQKVIRTNLQVDTRETFTSYSNQTDSAADVTFNLKDFKHMLALAEGLQCSIAMRFSEPGAPFVVEPVPGSHDTQACPSQPAREHLLILLRLGSTSAAASQGLTVAGVC